MAEKELALCDECGSLFFKGSSQMMGLCPECAHILYGYPNCDHHFQDGRCVNCYWDGSKSVYIKKQNQQEETDMPTTEWLNKYESIKDKLTCKVDLEAHFTEKVIGNMAVDVLDIGTVHFPTGQIFACDPLVELEDTLPFLQTIPAGTYPVKICVVPSEKYGDRYACVKVEVSREKPVRYELGMVGKGAVYMDMREMFTIDGRRFSNMAGFYDEVEQVFICGLDWKIGRNLNAFNDILRGGFGRHEYGQPIHIQWLAYEKSVRNLGKETMDTIVEIILDTDHSGHDCTLERL